MEMGAAGMKLVKFKGPDDADIFINRDAVSRVRRAKPGEYVGKSIQTVIEFGGGHQGVIDTLEATISYLEE